MTYYEELGITISASEEEIRRAHRLLTKILHPDQQTEEALRNLAGLQFRRINMMVDCLLDPMGRLGYDRTLAHVPSRAAAPKYLRAGILGMGLLGTVPAPQSLWRLAAVGLLAAFAITALTWRPSSDTWTSLSAAAAQPIDPANPAEDQNARIRSAQDEPERSPAPGASRRKAEAHRPEADARNIPPGAGEAAKRVAMFSDSGERNEPAIPVLPPPEIHAVIPASPHPASAPADTPVAISGTWIYAPRMPSSDADKLYKPEYIELKLQADGSAVFGQYKGRYVIPDRPISPTVAFQFTGNMTGNAGSFTWKGSGGGAAGRVDLKLLSERTLQVDWKATEVRDSFGLISGTAVLIRRK